MVQTLEDRQRIRAERVAAGLCTRCGLIAADKGYVTCASCRQHQDDLVASSRRKWRPKPSDTRTCVRCRAEHTDMDERLCVGCRDLVEPTEGCGHRWDVGLPVFEREDDQWCEITYGECARCGGQRTWALKEVKIWHRWSLKGRDDD